LWHGLGEEELEECERVIQTRKHWVVWNRARPTKGDRTPKGFEHVGKTVFCGKAKRSEKEQGKPEGVEDVAWKRGVVETKLNSVNMSAWVHKECDIMDKDTLLRLQGAWENPEQKDECIVRMNDFER
jgi:hypothetical protein